MTNGNDDKLNEYINNAKTLARIKMKCQRIWPLFNGSKWWMTSFVSIGWIVCYNFCWHFCVGLCGFFSFILFSFLQFQLISFHKCNTIYIYIYLVVLQNKRSMNMLLMCTFSECDLSSLLVYCIYILQM